MSESSLTSVLLLVAALQVKHFICDGPLQTLAMVKAKGFYGKRLGIVHASIHGVGTALSLALFGAPLMVIGQLAVLDTLVHYHVDYAKERLVRENGWGTNDGYFWWALTADQALHHMTYLLLAWLVIKL